MKIELDPHGPGGKDKPYCLINSDGSTAECFATHAEAVAAMGKTSRATRYSYSEDDGFGFALTPVQGFEFADDGGVWIEALQAKEYHTDKYGTVSVNTAKLNNLASSVKKNVRGIQLSTDYNHGVDAAKGSKASGTINDAKVEGDKLLLNVAFTDTAKAEIKAGEWKYFSSDWLDNYTHEDNSKHTDVLLGGGLTNRPVAKGLNPLPVNFSELFTENSFEYSDVDKEEAMLSGIAAREGFQFATLTSAQRKALPKSKFLYTEPDGTTHLPVPDEGHIRAAISRLSQKATGTVGGDSWLTDSLRSSLLSKARAMLGKKSMSEVEMNEFLKKLAETLSVQFSEDTTDEQLSESINTKLGEMERELRPLRELKATTEQNKTFAELYPDQAKQMEEDRQFRITANGKRFSETVGQMRFSETLDKKDAEGNDVVVTSTKGLSALALETISNAHIKFSEGTATTEDLEGVVNAIMKNGIVEYGEKGTSFADDEQPESDTVATGSIQEKRNAFAEKVTMIQSRDKDKPLTFSEALPIAVKEFPKMYEDYVTAGRG